MKRFLKYIVLIVGAVLVAAGMAANGRVHSHAHGLGVRLGGEEEMDNWGEIYALANESKAEMWKINEKFIRNQFDANKPFYFSHNPNDITIVVGESFYDNEINLLKQLVQQKYGKTAKFSSSNQYWKLEW